MVNNLVFADSNVGVIEAFTDHELYHPNRYQHIWFKTTDGGRSWKPVDFSSLNDSILVNNIKTTYSYNVQMPSAATIYIEFTDSPHIITSNDTGKTWSVVRPNFPDSIRSWRGIMMQSPNQGVMFTYDSGITLYTLNKWKSFAITTKDPILARASLLSNVGTHRSFDWSDLSHFTFSFFDSTFDQGRGITTLITDNMGISWKKHHYSMPGYEKDSVGVGNLKFLRGTSTLYGWTYNYSPFRAFDYTSAYIYSTDYGVTWNNITSFGGKRRAIEPVKAKHVWMTATKDDRIHHRAKATLICYTTDEGASWLVDSTTLDHLETGTYDGRRIEFVGERHGWIAAFGNSNLYVFRYIPDDHSDVRTSQLSKSDVLLRRSANSMHVSLSDGSPIVGIEIVDILGRSSRSVGSSFSLKDMHGLYHLRIQTHNGIIVKSLFVE